MNLIKRVCTFIITLIIVAICFSNNESLSVAHATAGYSKKINEITLPLAGTDLSDALAGTGTGGGQCWGFAVWIYSHVFNSSFPYTYNNDHFVTTYGTTIPTTADNLKTWILRAGPGAVVRVCNTASPNWSSDGGSGHSFVVVDANNDGVWTYQSGSDSKVLLYDNSTKSVLYLNEVHYNTWSEISQALTNGPLTKNGRYIKYILCPPAYRTFKNTPSGATHVYDENCTYKIIKDVTLRKEPFDSAEKGSTLSANKDTVTSVALYDNGTNYWLKLTNGEYIFAGYNNKGEKTGNQYLEFVSDNNTIAWNDNNISNVTVPYGKAYTLTGSITSSSASLVSVQGEFYNGNACWGNPTSKFTASGTSYSVANSQLDRNLSFASLPKSSDLRLAITVEYRYNRGKTASKTLTYYFSNNGTVATDYSLDPIVFNLKYYLEANPDVAEQNWSDAIVQKHWQTNGIEEGRKSSPTFDVQYYKNNNSDLSSMSNADAIKHYCTDGYKESRLSSALFNIKQYKINYPDLAEAYSNDDYELTKHFANWGYSEGRIAHRPLTVSFNANGGSVSTSSKSVQKTHQYGTLPTPTRSGYVFEGWWTAADGGTQITASSTFNLLTDQTLYAHWSKVPVYKISYNANGGTGAPSSQEKVKGTALTLRSDVPTREGYTFLGWATSASAATAQYQPGGSYTQDASVTLYAVWEKKPVYYELDVNGRLDGGKVLGTCSDFGTFDVYINGSLRSEAVSDFVNRELPSGTTYEIKNIKATSGYRYKGLASDVSHGGGLSGTIEKEEAYIVLDFVTTYPVTYNANGGTGEPRADVKDKGDATFKISSVRPTREGYTFLGWATSSSATTAKYQPGDSYTQDASLTLYAVWKQDVIYVSQIKLSEAALTLEIGDTHTLSSEVLPSNAANPTVTWSTDNSNVATVDNGTVMAVGRGTANITCTANDGSGVYAVCAITVNEPHTHSPIMIRPTLATSAENGLSIGFRCACGEVTQIQKTIENDGILSLPAALKRVDAEAFAGANMQQIIIPDEMTEIGARAFANCRKLLVVSMPDSVGSIADDAFDGCDTQYLCIVANDDSYAAQYADNHGLNHCSPIVKCNVIFDANGGECDTEMLSVEVGNALGSLPIPTKEGCIFSGWYKASGEPVDADTVIQESADVLLRAKWSCAITFNANGGFCANGSKTIYCGDAIGSLPTPTRTYYTFNGWYTASSGGTKVSESTTFAAATTLYAQWTRNTCTITFNANGGSCSTASKKINCGDAIGTLPTPTRTYYTFNGWYTASSGGTKVSETTTFAAATTLYAQWTRNTCTITFNANGGSCSTASKKINCGDAIGTLPTPTRTYYTFNGWYTASSGGTKVSETTTFAVATTLYAHWTVNQYTYTIRYVSSNGTVLKAAETMKKAYGSKVTITPPTFAGYNTPSAQTVSWDTTSKTVTFTYSPSSVAYSSFSGYRSESSPKEGYSAEIQYQNRTANSVQIRVVWSETLYGMGSTYNAYQGRFSGNCNNVAIPDTEVVPLNKWASAAGAGVNRTETKASSWITVPLTTTGSTSVSVHVEYYLYNSSGTNMYPTAYRVYETWSVAIPAY